jgi:hypothetical protein
MKNMYLIFLLLPTSFFAQRAQIGAFISAEMPNQKLMPNMGVNSSMGVELTYQPIRTLPMLLSMKGSLGYYSRNTVAQTYTFDNGLTTNSDVQYTSYVNKVLVGAKFYIGNEAGTVRGFITPQFGAAFMRTRILFMDPAEGSFCNPLDRRAAQKDDGFIYGGEAGVEVDMNRFFKTVQTPGRHRMYAAVSFTNGIGKFDYVNVKYMKDKPEATTGDGREVTTTFSDGSTTLYEQKIADIYTTSLQFIGLTVGYTYNF